jgi:hypothetical protein
MPRTNPISKYVPKKFGKIEVKNLSVFKLEAIPKSSPIDFNVSALSEESGWSLSDRLRFWHTLNGKSPPPATRLTIRKLEPDAKDSARISAPCKSLFRFLVKSFARPDKR